MKRLARHLLAGALMLGLAACSSGRDDAAPSAEVAGASPNSCTYAYSAWGTCTNGTQTRTVTSATPAGCTGTPVLEQSCSPGAPPSCTYTYSDWGTCTNGTQTRTVVSATPESCTGTPTLSQSCGTACTYTYGEWTACVVGTRVRTVLSALPAGCFGTPASLEQGCSTPATDPTAPTAPTYEGGYGVDHTEPCTMFTRMCATDNGTIASIVQTGGSLVPLHSWSVCPSWSFAPCQSAEGCRDLNGPGFNVDADTTWIASFAAVDNNGLQGPSSNLTLTCRNFGGSGGICPYIFTQKDAGADWLPQGTILTYQRDKSNERTQVKDFTAFSGRILIREIDPETSYIDYLSVALYYMDGSKQVLAPSKAELRKIDAAYLITNQCDEIEVDFDPPSRWDYTRAEVTAYGYYVVYGSNNPAPRQLSRKR